MIFERERSAATVCAKAARVARLQDSFTLPGQSHGQRALREYGARGARGEAEDEFPHLLHVGLPMLKRSISKGLSMEHARLNVLIAIMVVLDDTCLLHRAAARTDSGETRRPKSPGLRWCFHEERFKGVVRA